MARDRETICKFYICEHECEKGRDAEHNGYCQRCKLYKARCHEHHANKKKTELDKVNQKEANELINEGWV